MSVTVVRHLLTVKRKGTEQESYQQTFTPDEYAYFLLHYDELGFEIISDDGTRSDDYPDVDGGGGGRSNSSIPNTPIVDSSSYTALPPGEHIVLLSATASIELEDVDGVWEIAVPLNGLNGNTLTLTTAAGKSLPDDAGNQVQGETLVLDVAGVDVQIIRTDGTNYYVTVSNARQEQTTPLTGPFADGVEVRAFPDFTTSTLVTAVTAPTQAIDLGVDLSEVDFLDFSITANNSGEETRRLDLSTFVYDADQGGLLHWWDANGIRVKINTADIPTGRIYLAYLNTSSMRIERIQFRKLVNTSLTQLHRARLVLAANTALATAAATQLTFDSIAYDVGNIADLANNQVVIQSSGLYSLQASLFHISSNRVVQLFIQVNGQNVARDIASISNGDQVISYSPKAETEIELLQGDVITVLYYSHTASNTTGAFTQLIVRQLSTGTVVMPDALEVGEYKDDIGTFELREKEDPSIHRYSMNGQTITNGATLYPDLAAKWATWVSGNDLVLPDWTDRFVKIGNIAGALEDDATARNGLGMSADGLHNHTYGEYRLTGVDIQGGFDTDGALSIPSGGTSQKIKISENGNEGMQFTITNSTFSTAVESDHTHTITSSDAKTLPENVTLVLCVVAKSTQQQVINTTDTEINNTSNTDETEYNVEGKWLGNQRYTQTVFWTGSPISPLLLSTSIDPKKVIKIEGIGIAGGGSAWPLNTTANGTAGNVTWVNSAGTGFDVTEYGGFSSSRGGHVTVHYYK